MNAFTESVVEQAALDWFRALGYDVVGGPDMPPGPHALRESYVDTMFPSVLRGALARLNPNLPADALDDAFRKLTRPEGSSLEARNRAQRIVHRLHRYADRAPGRQHPGRVRRLHQHLRHPARRRGPGDGTDLLREPTRQARRSTSASGPGSTPASRRRPKARRSTARRSSRPDGRSSKRWSEPSSASGWWPETSSRISSSAPRPWTARRWSSA